MILRKSDANRREPGPASVFQRPDMKKKLWVVAGMVAGAGLVVLLAVTFFLGSIVKAAVNRYGPGITKTKVELTGARISPLTGDGEITGLLIGNPSGWTSDRAVYLGKAQLSVAPTSLWGDHIVIKRIIIEQPEFVFETRLFSSNIRDLLKNIESSTGGSQPSAGPAKTKSGKPLKLEIRQFVLRNGKVTIGSGADAVTVPMPELTLTDLGTKEGGITANQMAAVVMGQVLDQVLVAAASGLTGMGKASNTAANAANQAADAIKKLFGGGN